jgi:hypothetical protein
MDGIILEIALPAIIPMPAPAIGITMLCTISNLPACPFERERVRRAGAIVATRRRRATAVLFGRVFLFLVAILFTSF